MSVKKYILSVQKNQSTAVDDILTKPDPTKVSNMKQGSYEKLNDKGYVEPETVIEYGDAIFGKITPITDNVSANSKPYRDTSEIYKVGAPGVVDRVYLGTSNQDGYETRKAAVRSQREPKIGDKYCCAIAKTELLTDSGWKYFEDLLVTDRVATLVNGDTLEYREITHIHEYDHDGDIYTIKSLCIDLSVTLNHRMYVKMNNKYQIIEAGEVFGKEAYYKRNAEKTKICIKVDECYKEAIETLIAGYTYYVHTMKEANEIQIQCLHFIGRTCNIDHVGPDTYALVIRENEISNCGECIEYYKGKVYCCTVKEDKNNSSDGTLYVRRNGIPVWTCNSQHGQKGTIGILLDAIDMPFTKNGIRPDIIMNPNAVPSRMTIGQLTECVVGKAAISLGFDCDGTPFEDYDLTKIEKILESQGYQYDGKETLYNGMTGEQLKVKIFIGPTYYQRLKHLVADKIHCLHLDHEVLTENGWKKFPDIKQGERVATLDDGKLVYDLPTKLHYYPNYKGKMYKIETQQVSLDVTINHRMWVAKKHRYEDHDFDFELAGKVKGKHRKYKKNAIWECNDYQFILPRTVNGNGDIQVDKIVDMDSWLVFMGIWVAEGSATTDKKSNQNHPRGSVDTAVHKQRVKDALYPALEKLGYKYSISNDCLRIGDFQLFTYMKPFSNGAYYKHLPDWTWQLSKRQSIILLESMCLGDAGYYGKSKCAGYYTCSPQLANDFMRLALHCGWSANQFMDRAAGTETITKDGRTIKSNYDVLRLGVNKTKNTPAVNHSHAKEQSITKEEVYDFEGPVFCLEVPSEVFYVRRNGIPVWTGNSRSTGPKTSLTRQAPEGTNKCLKAFKLH